ncbi:MAG TPA: hypothetical protein VFQ45_01430 [Longimicrobium sp.]|nr:hypothetical protein [Longimicrobium sp.]
MRTMILVLLLAAAVPARAQENARTETAATSAAAGPYRWARPAVAVEHAEADAAEAAAQDRTNDFLYHVLLTAVSALITALIWRAVMD